MLSTRSARAFYVLTIFFIYIANAGCRGSGNVDLSSAEKLIAEPVDTPSPVDPTAPQNPDQEDHLHDLFGLAPGTSVRLGRLGAIDPTDTALSNDFDGDGILNENEGNSTMWVADYPQIETAIAPPITMQIEILENREGESSTITSDVNASDLESRKNEGSEKFHQNEVGLRTEQYEKALSQSQSSSIQANSSLSTASTLQSSINNSSTSSVGGGANASQGGAAPGDYPVFSVDVSLSSTSQKEYSKEKLEKDSYESTHSLDAQSSSSSSIRAQVFEDRPNRNNLDRTATSLKADKAAVKARNTREELNEQVNSESIIDSDAGLIRAALYIKNESVNMPVKLTNILCSFLFETPSGKLIPIKSFRLRKQDFSLLEVEVYGGSEFGPYVIELSNLNTSEIREAMTAGYTPKIFIIDYKMTHVDDSIYRSALDYSGNNLKIIEENAKGRTALIKVMGPGSRDLFRVSAFEIDPTEGIDDTDCDVQNLSSQIDLDTKIVVGTTLKKALQRLNCIGMDVEFGHYLIDFTGLEFEPVVPIVYTYGIKSINGVETNVPCATDVTEGGEGIGGTVEANEICHVKLAEVKPEEAEEMRIWTVYGNGKFYKHDQYLLENGSEDYTGDIDGKIQYYTGTTLEGCAQKPRVNCGIPTIKGVTSRLWAGDNFDIVAFAISEYVGHADDFGTNPINTGETLTFNTSWDWDQLGEYPYYPTTNSQYIGEAGFRDKVEFKFNPTQSFALNPDFGQPVFENGGQLYNDYSYDPQVEKGRKFDLYQLVDFEVNLGLGGTEEFWFNILRSEWISPNSTTVCPAMSSSPLPAIDAIDRCFISCGNYWDFESQEFNVCLQMPLKIDGFDSDQPLKVFLRPALNNAYRRSIWPKPSGLVYAFEGLVKEVREADNVIVFRPGIGAPNTNFTLKIPYDGGEHTFTVDSIQTVNGDVELHTTDDLTGMAAQIDLGSVGTVDLQVPLEENEFQFYDYPLFPPAYNAEVNDIGDDNFLADEVSIFVNGGDCKTNYNPYYCNGFGTYEQHIANWLGFDSPGNAWSAADQFNDFEENLFGDRHPLQYFTRFALNYYNPVPPQMGYAQYDMLSTVRPGDDHIEVVVGSEKTLFVWWEFAGTSNILVNNNGQSETTQWDRISIRFAIIENSSGMLVHPPDYLIDGSQPGNDKPVFLTYDKLTLSSLPTMRLKTRYNKNLEEVTVLYQSFCDCDQSGFNVWGSTNYSPLQTNLYSGKIKLNDLANPTIPPTSIPTIKGSLYGRDLISVGQSGFNGGDTIWPAIHQVLVDDNFLAYSRKQYNVNTNNELTISKSQLRGDGISPKIGVFSQSDKWHPGLDPITSFVADGGAYLVYEDTFKNGTITNENPKLELYLYRKSDGAIERLIGGPSLSSNSETAWHDYVDGYGREPRTYGSLGNVGVVLTSDSAPFLYYSSINTNGVDYRKPFLKKILTDGSSQTSISFKLSDRIIPYSNSIFAVHSQQQDRGIVFVSSDAPEAGIQNQTDAYIVGENGLMGVSQKIPTGDYNYVGSNKIKQPVALTNIGGWDVIFWIYVKEYDDAGVGVVRELVGSAWVLSADQLFSVIQEQTLAILNVDSYQANAQIHAADEKFIITYVGRETGDYKFHAKLIDIQLPPNASQVPFENGMNNFFVSPLFEHQLDVQARIVPPVEE